MRSRGVEVEQYDEPGLRTDRRHRRRRLCARRLARRPARQLDRSSAVQGRGGRLSGEDGDSGGLDAPDRWGRSRYHDRDPAGQAGPRSRSTSSSSSRSSRRRASFRVISASRSSGRRAASAGEYRTVYRFDNADHLRAWLDSDEHAAWLERAEPHVIGPMRTSFVTGLESWFTLPDRPGAPPPPPYKMALLTWITIFPLITAHRRRNGSAAR